MNLKAKLPRRYTVGWIVWMAITAGGFAALEGYALRHGEFDNTLTHHTRRALGIYPRKPWHGIGRAFLVFGALWLVNHMAFGPHSNSRIHRLLVDSIVRKVEL